MAYESKVIFNAVADVLETSKSLDEAYSRVARLANSEGVVLPKTRTKPTFAYEGNAPSIKELEKILAQENEK
ncbi:MAG: hypothetical protein FWF77_00900 [Defluviitaleaceae bacterium]|nr:hypothetical protein [Defluviitaleaceae bacterium]